MSGKKQDPRISVNYARMEDLIDRIQQKGPMTLTQVCRYLKITPEQWKIVRYRYPGRLALEDNGVSMPRPVHAEGYVYKIASNYRTGVVEDDGEPNFTTSLSDLTTRQATVYQLVDTLTDLATPKSKVQKLLKKARYDIGSGLSKLQDVAEMTEAPITEWAQHVLDSLP